MLCLLGFLVALKPSITGLQEHEWLGLAAAGVLLVHLLLHRDWVVSVTRRLNTIRSQKVIWRYNVDVGLFLGFTMITVTGILISTTFNLEISNHALWRFLHVLASYMTLGMLVLKIALHWSWIVNTTRRHILHLPDPEQQPATLSTPAGGRPASEHAASRREFLKTAGWAAAAILVAGGQTVGWIQREVEAGTTTDGDTVVSTDLTTTSYSSTASSGGVRCNKGCTSPRCPRWVDANGNSLCDLAEG